MKNIDINDLISKVNIVDIIGEFSTLTKAGASFKTLCNVHGDKTPSLSINPKKQIYKCFVCDHGGNALDYLIWAQSFSFKEALEYIIKASGENIEDYKSMINNKKYSEKELSLFSVLKDGLDLFNYFLNIAIDEGKEEIVDFVKKRNLSNEIISKFKIGYAPSYDKNSSYVNLLEKKNHNLSTIINASLSNELGDKPFFVNRIVFPIFDDENNVIAFSGRKIINQNDDLPKYINSRESLIFKKANVMYNYNNAKKHDQIIIVEGFMDVIALSRLNKNNAIALMGTALSAENINKLKKHKEVNIFLDNDKAGILATLKIIRHFITNNINGFVINNEFSKDPDEIINSEDGESKLMKCLSTKVNMIDFVFNAFTKDIKANDFQRLKKAIVELNKFSKPFDDFVKLDLISRISQKFEIEKNIVNKYFECNSNMVELKELQKNKQALESYQEKPLNINKLLISIWQNPSFLKSQNLATFTWSKAEFKKVYLDIKSYYESNGENDISPETKKFIRKYQEIYKSEVSLPKDQDSFEELIERSRSESTNEKLSHITNVLKNSSSEEVKNELLKTKLNIVSKKNGGK